MKSEERASQKVIVKSFDMNRPDGLKVAVEGIISEGYIIQQILVNEKFSTVSVLVSK